jgi:hypothetical protein
LHLGFNRRIAPPIDQGRGGEQEDPEGIINTRDPTAIPVKPWTFVSATLWHETDKEFQQLLESIRNLTSQWDRSKRKLAIFMMFDDPFEGAGNEVNNPITLFLRIRRFSDNYVYIIIIR